MRWFQNLSFRYKLMIPLAVIALLFLLFAWTTLQRIDALADDVDDIVRADLPVVSDILQADRDLYQALVAERSMIFVDVQDPGFKELQAMHAENMQQARERFDRAASVILSSHLADVEGIATLLEEYKPLRERWETSTDRVVSERAADTPIGRSNAIGLTRKDAAAAFDAMRDILDQLQDKVLGASGQVSERAEREVAAARLQVLVALVAGLVALTLVGVLMPALVIMPMRRILHRVKDIAEGEGDLRARLAVDSKDEVGQLAAAVDGLLEKLQGLVAHATDSASQLDTAATELAHLSGEGDRAMMEQSAQIQSLATAMNEMAATVNEVAVNTTQAAESARMADAGARSGGRVVGEASEAIQNLAGVVEKATEAIAALETDSNTIGTVLEVIKGVAEQTSLLALNAAIEAARAGESGRGFAVVAAEVRNLASRTQQSAGEIESMILALQSSARNVVVVMDSGREMVDRSLLKASEASGSLEEINQAVSRMNDMNTQIASATEEQSAVTEEINANTIRIQGLADNAVAASRQIAMAREQLVSLSKTLTRELSQFKV